MLDDCLTNLGVSENVVYPFLPNGFADHYPVFKLLFHWEYTQHFQTNPSSVRQVSRFPENGVREVHFAEASQGLLGTSLSTMALPLRWRDMARRNHSLV